MPTVGVVIPVYRCVPFVRVCLESVVAQTHPVDQIVLVDDCGGDESVAVATAVLTEHGREFTLVTQPRNGGLGRARNSGLAALTTDLVWFLDSDDWVEAEFVEVLHDALEAAGAEFAVTRTRRVDPEGRLLQVDEAPIPGPIVTGVEYARELVTGRAKGYACTKLFRRNVLGDRPWAEDQAYEDIATSLRVALSSDKVAMVNAPLYHYLYREGSISTALSPATFDLFAVEAEICELIADAGLTAQWSLEFTGFRYREVLTSIAYLAMREQHATGRRSPLTREAITRVRRTIDLRDIPVLFRGRHYREVVFGVGVKYAPALYSEILRWR
ncbi:glycosyltransferase family 2 protein [Gordonia sp. PKS22-38]|uniref:Glycosyltransferase family 2 protein n=1 Tax=Gordonia prachuapensis TaxID=3115651 RepID=A0ABU7MRP9_9ACTN|nr:glycosyltransferase family 2 protein [Gordonia sp. PKS22-38]